MSPRTPEPPDFPASQLFLRRLAFSLVRDEARAEDLVQDTWTAWIEHRPSGIAEPRAWLARVLRNRAFNEKRSERRRAEREELAGRPDPSMPEVDGTLEAQAQLIEALRKLEEPYRSTLVERYYHDLSPKEIAGRSGTPLNTIKARLLRGLTKLREEMDRRYGGDRSAWCHWLTVLGAPIAAPHGTPRAPHGAAPVAGLGGGGGMSLLGWLALAGVIAVGAVLKSEWGRAPRVEKQTTDERQASAPVRETIERGEPRRVPVATSDPVPRAERPASGSSVRPALQAPSVVPEPANVVRPGSARRETFDWPQYGGGADHDNYREREDEIFAPKVLWFVPGCAGQPTLEGGDLYAGGRTLYRLDPESGLPKVPPLERFTKSGTTGSEAQALERLRGMVTEDLGAWLRDLQVKDLIAPAPVVTPTLVLARIVPNGGVLALERRLVDVSWNWDPAEAIEAPWSGGVPLCLASDKLVLVAFKHLLIALRVADGKEAWRFTCNGDIRMVPASDGERVFFGMDRGQFYALDIETGVELWSASADCFGATAPLVVGKRVLVSDLGGLQHWNLSELDEQGDLEDAPATLRHPRLHAFDVKTGRELWRSPLDGFLVSLGLGPKRAHLLAGHGGVVDRFDLGSGKRDDRHRLEARARPVTSPTVVGKSLVFGDLEGLLCVHDLESGELRWTFRVARAKVLDLVHTGSRIYVSTSIGLFCLADDPTKAPPAAGYVLEWNGDPRKPSFLAEDETPEKQ